MKKPTKPKPLPVTDEPSMNADQFIIALDKAGIPTIVGAAPYLGISRRQSQRIASGDSPVPEPIAKLLRLVIKHRIKLEELLRTS